MTGCSRTGCEREACFAPKLCVPAMGGRRPPLEAVLALPVCSRHVDDLAAADFLDLPEGRPLREMFSLLAAGRFIPDLGEAFIEVIPIDGSEYRAAISAAGRLQ